ncbi:MAG: hypothetical protein KJO85_02415, partial [Gammaproteobacteria bacterium]|nr:hypothetical protein [Gammaproteobacteria bacterium]
VLTRIVLGGLILGIPVFFAGLLFPILLSRSPHPAAALGSNLQGAVIGGAVEYASMLLGLGAMASIAALFYLLAWYSYEKAR